MNSNALFNLLRSSFSKWSHWLHRFVLNWVDFRCTALSWTKHPCFVCLFWCKPFDCCCFHLLSFYCCDTTCSSVPEYMSSNHTAVYTSDVYFNSEWTFKCILWSQTQFHFSNHKQVVTISFWIYYFTYPNDLLYCKQFFEWVEKRKFEQKVVFDGINEFWIVCSCEMESNFDILFEMLSLKTEHFFLILHCNLWIETLDSVIQIKLNYQNHLHRWFLNNMNIGCRNMLVQY